MSYIRCAGCNTVQNIHETPFCADCRRCASCGVKVSVSAIECSCGYPNDPEKVAALVRRDGIHPSDVEFEKRMDAAVAKLQSIRLIVVTVGTAASTWGFSQLFNLDGAAGVAVTIVSGLVTMWVLTYGFNAWAKWIAGNDV